MQVLERLNPGYGIAAVRIAVGIVLFVAGYAKIMGPGIAGMTGFFTNVGIPMPAVTVPVVIGVELIGGLLLILGAFTRFVGPVMIVQWLVAMFVVSFPSQQGWNNARLDFLIVGAGILFTLAGAGQLSVDAFLASRRKSSEPVRALA